MNFGSKFNRVRQQADRLFLRGDRTDVVGELRYAEEQADELRILCEALSRSIEKSLNTHSVTEEKKHRKVPENQVAELLKESLKEVSQNQTEEFSERPLLKTTIEEMVGVEQLLGKEVLDYEDQVEAEVLVPLYKLLKEDFPSIAKQKKALKQAGQDVDAAKAKVRNSHTSISQPNKLENYKEELDEAANKLEQLKDSYACDLFNVLGKQREVARLSNLYLEMKVDYMQKSIQKLNVVLPPIRKIFEESSCSPVYGVPLNEHLRITQQEIAVPIQICAKRMIEFGMQEEGLLRMAGSNTKIKRLKGLFDAGLITVDTLLDDDNNRDYDVHVIAGAFKSYLRELPEPLLTHTKHDEMIEAVRKPDHKEKLRHMWQVINALPSHNYNNLRYVIKFLALLTSYASENKMTPNNIAIVMAPNLIGSQRDADNEIVALGRNMTLGNDYRVITEQLIEYSEYFFKSDVDFGVQPRRPEPPPSPKTGSGAAPNGTQFVRTGSHRRAGSTDFNIVAGNAQPAVIHPESDSPKQPHRMKKKPAPLPPQGKGEEGIYPPLNYSPEPKRSKTPPHNPTPSPAPRLLHTNSIKRPTSEPPKPPGGSIAPVKPPRPSPPAQVVEPQEVKSIRPHLPKTGSDALPQPASAVSTIAPAPPIGFENVESRNPTDESTESKNEAIASNDAPSDVTEKRIGFGFHIEGMSGSVRNKIRENELIQEQLQHGNENTNIEMRRSTSGGAPGGVTDPEFRKSLEGVLKQQPQAHARHLVRPALPSETSPAESCAVQLPVFPVPAQRSSKEAAEKPEPAPRSDKPAVPEKPMAINRSGSGSEHSKSVVHDRPIAVATKISPLSNSVNQAMSRSNEKIFDTEQKENVANVADPSSDCDSGNAEKPNKPPKPSNVRGINESATPADLGTGISGVSTDAKEPVKPIHGVKSDSTNL